MKVKKKILALVFSPADATNKFVDWSYTVDGIVIIDENGILTALAPGNVWVIASSLNNSSKKDTCRIYVKEAVDHVIADFDVVIPVTTEPQPAVAQLYTPEGTNDIAYANPLVNESNPSAKIVKWGRPSGDWRLIGMVLPTDFPQDLSQYAQFQFKYFGVGVRDFYIQMNMEDLSQVEINESVKGEDCWQLFTNDLSQNKNLVQFNVFVNKTGNPEAIPILFDDFVLAGKSMVRFDDISISESTLELNSPQTATLTADAAGHPFSWVSSDPAVAIVDQDGNVKAISGGTAFIKAVPLYGNVAECKVVVDGGTPSGIIYNVIADFEAIELDWSGGYGVYGWASDSVKKADNPIINADNNSDKTVIWKRDGTNLWGGFGFVFPMVNTSGWDLLAFQVLTTSTVNTIRLEVKNGDVVQGFYQPDNLGIQANVWTTVTFDLADLNIVGEDINTLNFQIAGGSDSKMLAYVDNILLRTIGDIKVTGISINETGPISKVTTDASFQLTANILPANATNKVVSWKSSDTKVVTVSVTGMVTIKGAGTATITAASQEDAAIKSSIQVNVSFPDGITADQNAEINIYPNPFNDEIVLSNLNKVEKIELTNILGSRLKQINTKGNSVQKIDTTDLPSGIYLLRFYSQSGFLATRKIVKK